MQGWVDGIGNRQGDKAMTVDTTNNKRTKAAVMLKGPTLDSDPHTPPPAESSRSLASSRAAMAGWFWRLATPKAVSPL